MLEGLRRKVARAIDPRGRETLDPTPVSVPAGFKRPETLEEQIRRLVRTEGFARAVSGSDEAESFDEADDFDVGEDTDPLTPYEEVFDPTLGRTVTAAEVLQQKDRFEEQTVKRVERAKRSVRPASAEPPAAPPPAEPADKPPST